MDTKEILQRFEQITEEYERELDQYNMIQLTRKPSDEDWSLGQMYLHLVDSAMNMQIRNIEGCKKQVQSGTEPNPDVVQGEKTEAGQGIFAMGGFPPIQIKVPASAQTPPPQPTSKEQIVQGLQQVVQRMREIEPELAMISSCYTVQHPRLGYLSATEWFVLTEMHYRHHTRQQARLKDFLFSTAE